MNPETPDTLLFVDDDAAGREIAAFNLRQAGFEVDLAVDGEQALARFDPARHLVVITDLKMPRVDGMAVLASLRERAPEVPVLVITAFGSMEVGVAAMRAGAYDVVSKPFSRDQLEIVVRRALERRHLHAERTRLERDNQRLRKRLGSVERPVVHASAAMAELLRLVDRVARSESTVLILGESGTGKELMARRLHARSRRADGPFVSVSCANLPAELIESELFGHEKGAFTGALRAREGRFRAAQGGTLFLDEVAEMPLPLQTRLLRALQERVVDVLGRDQPVPVDVRVLAATNRDPREEVRQGRFREDLYFRLAVIELRVPPLRERPEDIALLARHFVDLASPERELRIPESLLQTLRTRPWPGNVRELANACERMAVLAEGDELAVGDLSVGDLFTGALSPLGQTGDTAWMEGIPEGTSLVAVEKQLIAFTLRRCGGNLSAAARRLGVPRHILVYRLEKHGIPRQG